MPADVRLRIVNRDTGNHPDLEYVALRLDEVIAGVGGTVGDDLDGGNASTIDSEPTQDLDGGNATTI